MLAIAIIVASLLTRVVIGVGAPGLPSCAGSCVSSFGSCNQLNVKCICSDQSLIANLACCVSTVCDAADQEKTIKFANALCAGQGVTNLPQSATCAPGASGSVLSQRPTPVPQGSASTTAGTTTPSSVAASASSSLASASSSVLSVESSASKSAVSAQASASSSVLSAQSSASAAAAASSSSTGGANKMEMGMGLILAGVVAAL